MGQVKRPVSAARLAIVTLLRKYPDARNHQVAMFLGVTHSLVSITRKDYGLQRVPHPALLGKRPVPKPFRNRWKNHEAR